MSVDWNELGEVETDRGRVRGCNRGMKICISCKIEQPINNFEKHTTKDGRRNNCNSCRYKQKKKFYSKRIYGISNEQVEELKVIQNYSCAICKRIERLVIDHDHKTKEVRGLLCNGCNRGLGFFNDDTTALRNAVIYLSEGRGSQGETSFPPLTTSAIVTTNY